MALRVYGIKNCDSVKKALRFLKAHNLEYEFFDFKESAPSCKQVSRWSDAVGIKKLFNTHSTTYRQLGLKEVATNEEKKIEWMCKEPLLIKRPVIETDNEVLVGYDEETYTKSLL